MENSDQSQTPQPQTQEVTYWSYAEPLHGGESGTYRTLSEKQILNDYFVHWLSMMTKAGRDDLISERNCIDDWAVIHWATKTDKDGKQL